MREGPLADLFRSTTPAEESGEEGNKERSAEDETSVFEPIEPAAPERAPSSSDPESLPYDREDDVPSGATGSAGVAVSSWARSTGSSRP